jgi:hypothetical protein
MLLLLRDIQIRTAGTNVKSVTSLQTPTDRAGPGKRATSQSKPPLARSVHINRTGERLLCTSFGTTPSGTEGVEV